jgi:hypothetical protein
MVCGRVLLDWKSLCLGLVLAEVFAGEEAVASALAELLERLGSLCLDDAIRNGAEVLVVVGEVKVTLCFGRVLVWDTRCIVRPHHAYEIDGRDGSGVAVERTLLLS